MSSMRQSLLKPRQVAEYYQVTDRTIARWCRQQKLNAVKVGRVWRVYANDGIPVRLK